jgi:hypothetical protein
MAAESGVVRTERRNDKRIDAFFACELSSEAKKGRCGVTRNASHQGLLVVTPSRFEQSDRIELSLHADGLAKKVVGRIVRIDENGLRSSELWRYRLAIHLDEPLPEEMLERAGKLPFSRAG